jgi:transcriptional regulator with XRE-family HTH domain
MRISPAQCRAARALIAWSQDQLAAASKVAKATIANFEAGNREPYERTLDDVQAALEAAGVEFTNGGRPGVRMRSHRLKDAGQNAFPIDLDFMGLGATDGKRNITIRVERSALEHLDDQKIGSGSDNKRAFDKHRSRIFRIAAEKYEQGPIEGDVVSVMYADVAKGSA